MHSYEFQVKPKTGLKVQNSHGGEKNNAKLVPQSAGRTFIRIITCKLFPAPLSKLGSGIFMKNALRHLYLIEYLFDNILRGDLLGFGFIGDDDPMP